MNLFRYQFSWIYIFREFGWNLSWLILISSKRSHDLKQQSRMIKFMWRINFAGWKYFLLGSNDGLLIHWKKYSQKARIWVLRNTQRNWCFPTIFSAKSSNHPLNELLLNNESTFGEELTQLAYVFNLFKRKNHLMASHRMTSNDLLLKVNEPLTIYYWMQKFYLFYFFSPSHKLPVAFKLLLRLDQLSV